MSNSDKKDSHSSDILKKAPVSLDECGAAHAADIISDRWTLLIVREVFYGVKRYDDIRQDINIPRSVLTGRLKKLVEHGVLFRKPYQEVGARTRYQYELTEIGQELGLVLLALMQWGDKNFRQKKSAITAIHGETHKVLKVALIDEHTLSVPMSKVNIKLNTSSDSPS